jgi:hypothetical protein
VAYARLKVSSMKQLTSKPPISDGVTTEGSRASVVFAVTALGAFMAALDLSIVNVALPDPRPVPGGRARRRWRGHHRLHRVRRLLVTGGRRRPHRTAAHVHDRPRRVRRRLVLVRHHRSACVASRAAGRRRRLPGARLGGVHLGASSTRTRTRWSRCGAASVLAVATGPSLGAAIVSAGGWRGRSVNGDGGVTMSSLGAC